jgi:cyclic beta-1,2-glucan synthetase
LGIEPCIPRFWRQYEIVYRHGRTRYRIKVENPLGLSRGVATVELDGAVQPDDRIALVDDGQTHSVRVVMGEKPLVETAAARPGSSGGA